jgi:dienelactone hydrolase
MRGQAKLQFACVMATLIFAIPVVSANQDETDNRLSRLKPHMNIQEPSGVGPFPVMVMVTGCSGFHNERFQPSYDRTGNKFVELGYVVIRVDYLRSRGLENSCVGDQNPAGEVVPDREIAADVLASIEYAASIPNVRGQEIYVIGWSLGGRGILEAFARIEPRHTELISAAITYFPGCDGLTSWSVDIPLLMLLAEHDNIQPPNFCSELVAEVSGHDSVELHVYPDAHHCFTTPELPIVTEPRTEITCAYSPDADKASWQQILAFLTYH